MSHLKLQQTFVLTANRRTAEWLKAQNTGITKNNEKILPLQQFIFDLWEKYATQFPDNTQTLLSTAQVHYLWKNIFQKNKKIALPVGLLKIMWEAWRLTHQYQIKQSELNQYANTPDQLDYSEWFESISKYYQQHQLIDEYTLPATVLKHFEVISKRIKHCKIKYYAFLDFNPIELALFEALKSKGISIEKISIESKIQSKKIFDFEHEAQELEAMVDWCVHNANKKIACVVPDLESIRFKIDRQLSRQLQKAQFNISSPIALTAYPVIADLILWLDWLETPLEKFQIIQLLHSEYFLCQHDTLSWSTYLENIPGRQCSYFNFYRNLPKTIAEHFPKPFSKKAFTFEDWHLQIKALMQKLNYLSTSNDYENALYLKFNEKLVELISISKKPLSVSYTHFLKTFKWILNETRYEPNVNHQAPIQILGQLESAGLSFDKVWLFASNELNWPQATKPNPLISHTLQKEKQIPQADPNRTLSFYQALFNQIIVANIDVNISYSQQVEALPIEKSDFIKDNKSDLFPIAQPPQTAPLLEWVTDEYGPPLTENNLTGGTHALTLQAQCPFKGFAFSRLKVKSFEAGSDYIDFATRGQLVHAIMATLWQQLKTQTTLKKMQATLKTLIEKIVTQTIKAFKLDRFIANPLLTLEKKRLVQTIWQWFQTVEITRPPFIVKEIESAGDITIENINIRFRLDRADQLESGQTIIIDYKTGLHSPQSWLSDPLSDPQLPLYLLAQQADGIAFAQIRHKQMDLKTLQANDPNEWHELRNYWKKSITNLVDAIKNGYAKAEPVDLQICSTCEYAALCRITAKNAYT